MYSKDYLRHKSAVMPVRGIKPQAAKRLDDEKAKEKLGLQEQKNQVKANTEQSQNPGEEQFCDKLRKRELAKEKLQEYKSVKEQATSQSQYAGYQIFKNCNEKYSVQVAKQNAQAGAGRRECRVHSIVCKSPCIQHKLSVVSQDAAIPDSPAPEVIEITNVKSRVVRKQMSSQSIQNIDQKYRLAMEEKQNPGIFIPADLHVEQRQSPPQERDWKAKEPSEEQFSDAELLELCSNIKYECYSAPKRQKRPLKPKNKTVDDVLKKVWDITIL